MNNALERIVEADYGLTLQALARHGVTEQQACDLGMPSVDDVYDRLANYSGFIASREELGVTSGDRLVIAPHDLHVVGGSTIEESSFIIGEHTPWTVAIALQDTDLSGGTMVEDSSSAGLRYVRSTLEEQKVMLANEAKMLDADITTTARLAAMSLEQYVMLSQISRVPLGGVTRFHTIDGGKELAMAGLAIGDEHQITVSDLGADPKKGIRAVLQPRVSARVPSVVRVHPPQLEQHESLQFIA